MKHSLTDSPVVSSAPAAGPWAAWDRFWFKPADPINLGFIRLCAGLVILYVHVAYTFGLLNYVGPEAWLDVRTSHYLSSKFVIYRPITTWKALPNQNTEYTRGHRIFSLYFYITDPFWIYAVHAGIVLAMFLFTIGLWTRLTSVLSWIGAACYLHRAPTTLFGMDTMMNLLLIYLAIAPSGAALSVDRWLRVRRAARRGLTLPPPEPLVSANFAMRLMQVNFCIIYMASGTSKLLGPTWWNGTALWSTVANYSFAPMTVGWYFDVLVFLSQHRWLWEICMSLGVMFTLFMEIGLPFLIWLPKMRWFMICGSVLLHTGIGLTMGLGTFSLMMLCLLFSFVPPPAVHYLVDRLRGVGDAPAPEWSDKRQTARGRQLASAG